MSSPTTIKFDPKFDLILQRRVDLPREAIWKAWTTPAILMKWFCPLPWKTTSCQIDLRPGGRFNTVMRSPEGKDFPNTGCYLETLENERLVWTNALEEGFRPAKGADGSSTIDFFFTAAIILEPLDGATQFTAIVCHASQAAREQHDKMGFTEGWGIALDQLIAAVKEG